MILRKFDNTEKLIIFKIDTQKYMQFIFFEFQKKFEITED